MDDDLRLIDRDALSDEINNIPLSEAENGMTLYRAVLKRLSKARTICVTEKWHKFPEEIPTDEDTYIVTIESPDLTTEHQSTKRRIKICEYNQNRAYWYDIARNRFLGKDECVVAFRRFPRPYSE